MTRHAALDATEMLARLIAFDTVSRNSNLELVAFVADDLDRLGVPVELVPDASGTKAGLLARIGPEAGPGIVLSGHTDVVPVDGQAWRSDPFRADLRDGRVYGRGAADMKGFVAAVLALVPEIVETRLSAPVHLALSYDEEVGCKGVPDVIARLIAGAPHRPKGCLVGEPTGMRVVNGHKGKGGYRCTVQGLAGHSSAPAAGVNAIEVAARLVARIAAMNRRFRREGPFALDFEPPHTTASTGTIEGGSALNIIPERCRFAFEFRTLPGHDPTALLGELQAFAEEELLPEMRDTFPGATIAFEELLRYPGLDDEPDGEIERVACAITATERPGKVAFGTEAGHFAARGIPAVVCGPGEIAVAHKPDEYVELAQLARCGTFLRQLVARMVTA